MAQDTAYQPFPLIFASHGIVARLVTDRVPESMYLNLGDAEEREENAISSRYGSIIVNRDPNGTPNGVNYFFVNPIVSLSRLNYAGVGTWRYAADNAGALFRRAGDTQGAYTQIDTGLSGTPFSSVVNTCYGSSTPFLFIADASLMIKDSGSGSPTRIGILPPNQIANTTPYAANFLTIDLFNTALGGYGLINVSGWSSVPIGSVLCVTFNQIINNFVQFFVTSGGSYAFDGAVASVSNNLGTATMAQLFDVYGAPLQQQMSGYGINGTLSVTGTGGGTTFSLNGYQGTVAASTTGTVYKNNVFIDMTQNNQVTDDDLIVLTMAVSEPQNIEEIRVIFITDDSQGSNAYYYKSVTPVYYQSGIAQTTDPYQTTLNQVFWQTGAQQQSKPQQQPQEQLKILGVPIPGVTVGSPGGISAGVSQLSPVNFSSGVGWVAVYMRRGDFVPVGNAGQENHTWANVGGWRVQITTNANGSTNFSLNGLYLQWGYGPSSYGGVGYDYRYTYYNVNTQTESNGSQIQYYDEKYGTASSLGPLIVLRQAINVQGVYSQDPQVTHVRIYRRGGYLGDNWYLVDKIPNVTGTGGFSYFNYKDIIPDADLLQANTLILDNDVPVTSTLRTPISTFLQSSVGGAGNSVYSQFSPVTITVTNGSAQFLLNQILVIGTPENLEQVPVETAGTGTCNVTLRLQHAAGEPVQAFAVPAQPVDLVEIAYGQMWWAGDPNNPHYLYYSKPGYPENCGPQNYIQVSEPSDPIMGVINFRGTLFVATLETWYQIIGGAAPYAQPTGSKHGLVAKHGWCQTESAIWYQANDGIREFRGADGNYESLPIEWLFRDDPGLQSQTPIPQASIANLSQTVMAFQNNFVYVAYATTGLNNGLARLAFSTVYRRWRNDTIQATTMFWEADTNTLLYCRNVPAPTGPGYAICQDRIGDVDDMGWNSQHVLVENNININVQTPYQDLGKPHFPKQWNMLEVDADANNGVLQVFALFETGVILNLGSMDLVGRQKYQFPINAGNGYEAYRMSVQITGYGEMSPPNLYQLNIYAAVLAANRNSYDTYWIHF